MTTPVSVYEPRAHGARCDECPLNGSRVVPPQTAPGAVLAIVGEAPGYNEVERGLPFIGRSGNLLDALLRTVGQRRDRTHVTNAVLCRPPEEEERTLRRAIECCTPRLHRELLSLRSLRAIFPVGGSAIRALGIKRPSILFARGFVWDITIKDGKQEKHIPAVPSVHPAFVLRAPAWEPVLGTDLAHAKRIVNGMSTTPEYESVLAPGPTDVSALLAKLRATVAIDVETSKLGPTTCDLLCVGISDGHLSIVLPWARGAAPDVPYYGGAQGHVRRALARSIRGRTVVTHNGHAFDGVVLARYGVELCSAKRWDDTIIAHHAYASHFPQRLDHVVSMYLDVPPWKWSGKHKARSDEKGVWDPAKISNEELWKYNCQDAAYTALAWFAMQNELDPERSVYETDLRVGELCRRMREHGVALDLVRREHLRRKLSARRNRLLGELRRISDLRSLEPNKLADLRAALFERLGARMVFRTAKGSASTNRDTLQQLAQSSATYGEFARTLLLWREVGKLVSTYIVGIEPEKDGRIHPEWRAWGTTTGRLACRDPNLQNIPIRTELGKLIRELFVALRGRVFVAWDLRQVEMRLAAYLSGDENFIRSCEQEDVHAANAEAIFGTLPPKDTPDWKRLRGMAKSIGFAINYGAGAETVTNWLLSQGVRVEMHQVVAMLSRLRRAYPRYFEWQEENLKRVQREAILRTAVCGRKRWFGHVPFVTELMDYPMQGTTADIMNMRLTEIDDALPKGATTSAQVHDGGIHECSEAQAERTVKICRSIVERPFEIGGRKIRFPVDVKVGRRWSEI